MTRIFLCSIAKSGYASAAMFESFPLRTTPSSSTFLQPQFWPSSTCPFPLSLPFFNFLFQLPLSSNFQFFENNCPPSSLRDNFVFYCFTLAPMRPRQRRWQKLSQGNNQQTEIKTPKPKLKFISTLISNFPLLVIYICI
uniref:Uncharacterized protein n=1 Tax=Opuntia streptacantha TaxID=393608 RepID=A0A7C9ELR3_OPUST